MAASRAMIVTATVISASASAAWATFVNTVLIALRDSKPESKVTKKIGQMRDFYFEFEGMRLRPASAGF